MVLFRERSENHSHPLAFRPTTLPRCAQARHYGGPACEGWHSLPQRPGTFAQWCCSDNADPPNVFTKGVAIFSPEWPFVRVSPVARVGRGRSRRRRHRKPKTTVPPAETILHVSVVPCCNHTRRTSISCKAFYERSSLPQVKARSTRREHDTPEYNECRALILLSAD
eukprot:1762802-Pyramimonas_sp.AAC.1